MTTFTCNLRSFYMQPEINDRERQIRQRQATPQAEEQNRPLVTPLFRLLGLMVCVPRAVAERVGSRPAPANPSPKPDPKPASR